MGNSKRPGIQWPGKAAGCQHSEGSWGKILTQLPGESPKVMLTWTWSWQTRKSWSAWDHQCPPWLSWPGNSGVPGTRGEWGRRATEYRLVDSRGEDFNILGSWGGGGLIQMVSWGAALKGKGTQEIW